MRISTRAVVAKVLLENGRDKFTADPIALHRAFYELYRKNPDELEDFDFIKRGNPYSPSLDTQLQILQLSGVLSRLNPDFVKYEINRERVAGIVEPDEIEFSLEGTEVIDALFE